MNDWLEVLKDGVPGTGLVSLVTMAVVAVWRGWLVPRRTVDTLVAVQADRLAEARARELEWRAAWQTAEEARRVLDGHVQDVVDSLRTVEALVRAIPAAPPRNGGGRT